MADIFSEAELSAGAVYGHFNSKHDIIGAIAEEVIGQIFQVLEPIFTQSPPPRLDEAVRQGLTATDEFAFGDQGYAYLAPQVWAEALRDPSLAEIIQVRYRAIHGLVSQLVVAEQDMGRTTSEGDPDEVAKVLLSVLMGYILQRLLIGDVGPASYAAGLGALTQHG